MRRKRENLVNMKPSLTGKGTEVDEAQFPADSHLKPRRRISTLRKLGNSPCSPIWGGDPGWAPGHPGEHDFYVITSQDKIWSFTQTTAAPQLYLLCPAMSHQGVASLISGPNGTEDLRDSPQD